MIRTALQSIIVLLLLACPCTAQKQGNIWYFGDRAGVDFNGATPVPLLDGKTYPVNGHSEGTAAISDPEGRLLFYTNGEKIWNRHHRVMPNGDGLLGSTSSTTSSLIVPLPWSDHLYYVFTTDSFYPDGLRDGLRYSVVDLCRDGGVGDVIPEQKNVLLLRGAGEKLCAAVHANGNSIWVVTHEYGSDAFYAFLLTWRGIVDTVVTRIGSSHNLLSSQADAGGQMKISPDGRWLALCNANILPFIAPSVVELFAFDDRTGRVSRYINLASDDAVTIGTPYGIAFSPDSRMLYVSRRIATLQYDLSSDDSATIAGSALRVSPPYDPDWIREVGYGMQLGPDGKIYASTGYDFLEVISQPNVRGTGCGYQWRGLYLQFRASSISLPAFIDSYIYSGAAVCAERYWMTLLLPDTVTGLGETIEIPIRIQATAETRPVGPRHYTARLRFDKTLLAPASSDASSTIDGDERILTVSGIWDGRTDVVCRIALRTFLGRTGSSEIVLDDFEWEGSVPYHSVNGRVEVVGYCETGDRRLVGMSVEAGLKTSPDPVRGRSTIEVSTPEDGRTRVYVADALGRRAATILDAHLDAGTHSLDFDARSLSSGAYTLVLETPTRRVTRPMRIVE